MGVRWGWNRRSRSYVQIAVTAVKFEQSHIKPIFTSLFSHPGLRWSNFTWLITSRKEQSCHDIKRCWVIYIVPEIIIISYCCRRFETIYSRGVKLNCTGG